MQVYKTFGISVLTLSSLLGCGGEAIRQPPQQQSPLENPPSETTPATQEILELQENTKHPLEQAIPRLLEELNKNPAQQTQAQTTLQEYITLEGTVTGRSYYEFKDGKPTAYFFLLKTEQGIKTIQTPINDEFEYNTIKEIINVGTQLKILVDKQQSAERFYFISPDKIRLKIPTKITEDTK